MLEAAEDLAAALASVDGTLNPVVADVLADYRGARAEAVAEIVSSGVWICELPELDSTSRADISAVKALLADVSAEQETRREIDPWEPPIAR